MMIITFTNHATTNEQGKLEEKMQKNPLYFFIQ